MIKVDGVGKAFRPPATLRGLLAGRLRGAPVVALDGVTLDVAAGEIVGVMGPNGAGKSTLLRLVAGLLSANAGTVTVAGLDAGRGGPQLAAAVGYVGADERGLMEPLSAREHLAFFAALHGYSRGDGLARADALLGEVGLAAAAGRPLIELSTGMRRRVALARARLGAPRVLVLDEPTRGVDPAGAAALRAHLTAASAGGAAVLLATHDVEEARALCRRVLVLVGGRTAALEAPEAAAARLRGLGVDGTALA